VSDKPDFDSLAKALETASKHESTVTQLFTLAVEYEAKSITAERFAQRSLEILRLQYMHLVKSPSAAIDGDKK